MRAEEDDLVGPFAAAQLADRRSRSAHPAGCGRRGPARPRPGRAARAARGGRRPRSRARRRGSSRTPSSYCEGARVGRAQARRGHRADEHGASAALRRLRRRVQSRLHAAQVARVVVRLVERRHAMVHERDRAVAATPSTRGARRGRRRRRAGARSVPPRADRCRRGRAAPSVAATGATMRRALRAAHPVRHHHAARSRTSARPSSRMRAAAHASAPSSAAEPVMRLPCRSVSSARRSHAAVGAALRCRGDGVGGRGGVARELG